MGAVTPPIAVLSHARHLLLPSRASGHVHQFVALNSLEIGSLAGWIALLLLQRHLRATLPDGHGLTGHALVTHRVVEVALLNRRPLLGVLHLLGVGDVGLALVLREEILLLWNHKRRRVGGSLVSSRVFFALLLLMFVQVFFLLDFFLFFLLLVHVGFEFFGFSRLRVVFVDGSLALLEVEGLSGQVRVLGLESDTSGDGLFLELLA